MPNSILLDQPAPIAIVCHDAGAANIIFAWMRADATKQPESFVNWRLLVQGPAEALWEKSDLMQVRLCQTIDEVFYGANSIISGTGWASSLEYDSVKAARQHGIRSIAVIDHWTNYRARFERNGEEVLPDEIWIIDDDAKKLAESEFENIRVVQKPNLYLEEMVQKVRSHECGESANCNLLYVLEPIRDAWGLGVSNGELSALEFFIQNIGVLGLRGNLTIRLRSHPSDPAGKYDQWIEQQGNINITLDQSLSLEESIAWANVVVGCQTYAMVVALAAGRQVFSSVPPWAPPCLLPQEGIVKMSELVQQVNTGLRS